MGPHGNGTAARKRLHMRKKKKRVHKNANSATIRPLIRRHQVKDAMTIISTVYFTNEYNPVIIII